MPRAKKADAEREEAAQIRALLMHQIPQAIAFLTTLMQDEGQKPELRMKAAESILDRACGKGGGALGGGGEVSVRFEGVLDEWSK